MKLAKPLLTLLLLLDQTVAIAVEIAIGNLADLDFGQVPPTIGTLSARSDFCVAIEPRGRYQISATGDGAGGRFDLVGGTAGAVNALRYRVFVAARGRGPGTEVQPGVPLIGLRGKRPKRDGRCSRPYGSIVVQIDADELAQARSGRYRGTLNMTVGPE